MLLNVGIQQLADFLPKIQIVLNDAEIGNLQIEIDSILIYTFIDYTFKLFVIFIQNYFYEHNFLNSCNVLALDFQAKLSINFFSSLNC